MTDKNIQQKGGKATAIPSNRKAASKRATTDIQSDCMPRLDDAQIDTELAARGETRASVMASFELLESRVRATLAAKNAATEPICLGSMDFMAEPPLASFKLFDDCVAAGSPAWDHGNGGKNLSLADLFGKQNWDQAFFTRVTGWSMIGDHIQDGDLLLVDSSKEAKDGDIIVAHLAGQGQVVKRLRIAADAIYLDSSNPEFAPIRVDDHSTLAIHGVVKSCTTRF